LVRTADRHGADGRHRRRRRDPHAARPRSGSPVPRDRAQGAPGSEKPSGSAPGGERTRMSIPVPLDRLRAALHERGGQAYLLTVSHDARPHAVHGTVAWEGDLLVTEVGKRTAANAAERPEVSLMYPVRVDGDYSLIIDGTARVESWDGGQRVLIAPTKAVLHRPAAAPDPTSPCAADCVPLLTPPPRGRG